MVDEITVTDFLRYRRPVFRVPTRFTPPMEVRSATQQLMSHDTYGEQIPNHVSDGKSAGAKPSVHASNPSAVLSSVLCPWITFTSEFEGRWIYACFPLLYCLEQDLSAADLFASSRCGEVAMATDEKPALPPYPELAVGCVLSLSCVYGFLVTRSKEPQVSCASYGPRLGVENMLFCNLSSALFLNQMILAAIDALNDKNGSNKSKISKYIESQYADLPAGHSMLLSHHLNKMKDAGELAFAKNNYLRPDPSSPPKRGRGRPPKPKEPLPAGYVPPSPRPRGRPPKAKDPNALPPAPKPKSGDGAPKRRGRPPKKAPRPAGTSAPAAPGVKRGRGRPPKVKPAVAAVGA
ncbi:hypothetical protein Taro_021241 [Colocasia esculenta]|uniref:H15 domain-containing protein n=1 Tax=Colocasia esculenta TaxID=4460 RepID=A0A843UQW0_COLES|nr:hypothetical protein [Colocasia esculenta]